MKHLKRHTKIDQAAAQLACALPDICLPGEAENLSRRHVLAGGVSLSAYVSLAGLVSGKKALAQDGSFAPQRKLVWISMGGGWDILEVTDPKVASTAGIDMIYGYDEAHELAQSTDGTRIGRWLPGIAALGQDVLVVRGLAMGTTSHNAGPVYCDTGILSNAGQVNAASIPAIVASESQATIPIIQLNGGMEPQTDRGLLNPVSVVRADNLQLYRSMYPTDEAAIQRKMHVLDYLRDSITRMNDEVGDSDRITGLAAAESKIRTQFEANVGEKLALTDADRAPFLATAGQRMNNGMAESFAMAAKLLKNDIVTCVNLGIGGFDTHSNQTASLQGTLTNVDFVIATLAAELRAAGILDQTLIVMYSDFGRTPKINRSNGRDHWPTGGALMIGGGIQGGRAIGATDDNLQALEGINPNSGLADSGGVQLNPTHLGGAVVALTLGASYLQYRPYLTALPTMIATRSG